MTGVFDVLVIGGGPAGLSAALWLARYRRRVRVLDSGQPRNAPAWGVHGYPGLVDPSPSELRDRIHDQAINAGAEHEVAEAIGVAGERDRFEVRLGDDRTLRARRIVLAYGLRDYIPAILGVHELYGVSVFHCPDCDGPMLQGGQSVGVIGADRHAARLALYLVHWTPHVTLLANGEEVGLDGAAKQVVGANGINVVEARIVKAVAEDGRLNHVELETAPPLPLDVLFFHLGSEPRCDIAEQLGCERDDEGYLRVDRGQETPVAGVHAVGDITGHPHLAITAAAEGVHAALAIHRSLLPADRRLQAG
jgi:thioredoxin reductase